MTRLTWLALVLVGCNGAPVPSEKVPVGVGYDNHGLVVHEWGTNTVVVGSDGAMLRGLHHEEEDLPQFVYDRIKTQRVFGGSVITKMETPVLYFYSPAATKVRVAVDFPRGVMTQWFPAAPMFYPPLAMKPLAPSEIGDPALDPGFPFRSATCAEKYGVVANGLLDWGEVEVLPREMEPALLEAPLEKFTWSHARKVSANALRTKDESEKFLFYRGLGNVPLPVEVTNDGATITLENRSTSAMPEAFVIRRGADSGGFTKIGALAAGERRTVEMPTPGSLPALGDALAAALVKTGLFADEAAAMVATWKRQWFESKGWIAVLYLMPQELVEEQIPLRLDPKPEKLVRTMVIRVEVLRPLEESNDMDMLERLSNPAFAETARTYYKNTLGRFGEPRLRRAMALLGEPAYAKPLLDEITGANAASAAQ